MEKYHSVHEKDISSFDLPSTRIADRLPTVSAADALEELDGGVARHVSTGIGRLDEALTSSSSLREPTPTRGGGLQRGQVTEIWGPPGSGKTATTMRGKTTTRLTQSFKDCAYTVCGHRLNAVVEAVEATQPSKDTEVATSATDHFAHYGCPSLPHLIALLCRPTAATVPANSAVVVIDSLSALVNHAFPKAPDGRKDPPRGKDLSLSARRLQALQYITSALQKLAATRDCAVVVLSQCATKMQLERSATLIPSINAGVWEQGMSTRVVLFRDWVWKEERPWSVCFAGVQKLDGKAGPDMMQSAAAFRVEATGVVGVQYDTSQPSVFLPAAPRAKRKLAEAGLEVPDSEEDDEEYGWAREDESTLPGPPPQWQGSEDILLGTQAAESEDDGSSDGDGHGDGGDGDDEDDKAEDVDEAATSGRDNQDLAE
ncbi:P-loop containing nucleoside triphosphate hydrolase protein [Colletotrichum phormii]|uniref:P-loop containing nucleoside triphosphate hydrolase protein n=1 Tax=Colletotrichum phormii TaxID=359342 RepID=A0AAJ0EDW0_9PEZI|nr:P-loop containing nucleoside triphosphate hydrolase protein [Colletotrichum phormii]KAK1635138.1 P-loop containing nucleoside triphosphate hydrolase protein [Colletotrichum phormii]